MHTCHCPRRSIPAHAGEPSVWRRRPGTAAVYPRPRGGAGMVSGARISYAGLSPPTRGSRQESLRHCCPTRSIPAHAGEPKSWLGTGERTGVYPRPRGGAAEMPRDSNSASGLSPPTRGSQGLDMPTLLGAGSIPAHAGEPATSRPAPATWRVYPRPRGGADADTLHLHISPGLSPPTRGSPACVYCEASAPGSIPAHAGEPTRSSTRMATVAVYPRPRGGAGGTSLRSKIAMGLSPPTRGSLTRCKRDLHVIGSIPAHAGEP